jgi:hypothetical protein
MIEDWVLASPLPCPNRNRILRLIGAINADASDLLFRPIQVNPLPQTGWDDFSERAKSKYLRCARGDALMAKELRTAEQLSEMLVSALGVREVDVQIRKDHAYGWQPTVVSSPGDLIGYQRRVDEIANRLRFQFALRE